MEHVRIPPFANEVYSCQSAQYSKQNNSYANNTACEMKIMCVNVCEGKLRFNYDLLLTTSEIVQSEMCSIGMNDDSVVSSEVKKQKFDK